MKLNWGSGIAIFYSCFMIAMIYMVFKSTQNKSHLVQENYYEKDLNYESFRLKRQNGESIKRDVSISLNRNEHLLIIDLPDEMAKASGEVSLFRPSNKFLDKKYPLSLDTLGRMELPLEKSMKSGRWKTKLDWAYGGKDYYLEEDIIL